MHESTAVIYHKDVQYPTQNVDSAEEQKYSLRTNFAEKIVSEEKHSANDAEYSMKKNLDNDIVSDNEDLNKNSSNYVIDTDSSDPIKTRLSNNDSQSRDLCEANLDGKLVTECVENFKKCNQRLMKIEENKSSTVTADTSTITSEVSYESSVSIGNESDNKMHNTRTDNCDILKLDSQSMECSSAAEKINIAELDRMASDELRAIRSSAPTLSIVSEPSFYNVTSHLTLGNNVRSLFSASTSNERTFIAENSSESSVSPMLKTNTLSSFNYNGSLLLSDETERFSLPRANIKPASQISEGNLSDVDCVIDLRREPINTQSSCVLSSVESEIVSSNSTIINSNSSFGCMPALPEFTSANKSSRGNRSCATGKIIDRKTRRLDSVVKDLSMRAADDRNNLGGLTTTAAFDASGFDLLPVGHGTMNVSRHQDLTSVLQSGPLLINEFADVRNYPSLSCEPIVSLMKTREDRQSAAMLSDAESINVDQRQSSKMYDMTKDEAYLGKPVVAYSDHTSRHLQHQPLPNQQSDRFSGDCSQTKCHPIWGDSSSCAISSKITFDDSRALNLSMTATSTDVDASVTALNLTSDRLRTANLSDFHEQRQLFPGSINSASCQSIDIKTIKKPHVKKDKMAKVYLEEAIASKRSNLMSFNDVFLNHLKRVDDHKVCGNDPVTDAAIFPVSTALQPVSSMPYFLNSDVAKSDNPESLCTTTIDLTSRPNIMSEMPKIKGFRKGRRKKRVSSEFVAELMLCASRTSLDKNIYNSGVPDTTFPISLDVPLIIPDQASRLNPGNLNFTAPLAIPMPTSQVQQTTATFPVKEERHKKGRGTKKLKEGINNLSEGNQYIQKTPVVVNELVPSSVIQSIDNMMSVDNSQAGIPDVFANPVKPVKSRARCSKGKSKMTKAQDNTVSNSVSNKDVSPDVSHVSFENSTKNRLSKKRKNSLMKTTILNDSQSNVDAVCQNSKTTGEDRILANCQTVGIDETNTQHLSSVLNFQISRIANEQCSSKATDVSEQSVKLTKQKPKRKLKCEKNDIAKDPAIAIPEQTTSVCEQTIYVPSLSESSDNNPLGLSTKKSTSKRKKKEPNVEVIQKLPESLFENPKIKKPKASKKNASRTSGLYELPLEVLSTTDELVLQESTALNPLRRDSNATISNEPTSPNVPELLPVFSLLKGTTRKQKAKSKNVACSEMRVDQAGLVVDEQVLLSSDLNVKPVLDTQRIQSNEQLTIERQKGNLLTEQAIVILGSKPSLDIEQRQSKAKPKRKSKKQLALEKQIKTAQSLANDNVVVSSELVVQPSSCFECPQSNQPQALAQRAANLFVEQAFVTSPKPNLDVEQKKLKDKPQRKTKKQLALEKQVKLLANENVVVSSESIVQSSSSLECGQTIEQLASAQQAANLLVEQVFVISPLPSLHVEQNKSKVHPKRKSKKQLALEKQVQLLANQNVVVSSELFVQSSSNFECMQSNAQLLPAEPADNLLVKNSIVVSSQPSLDVEQTKSKPKPKRKSKKQLALEKQIEAVQLLVNENVPVLVSPEFVVPCSSDVECEKSKANNKSKECQSKLFTDVAKSVEIPQITSDLRCMEELCSQNPVDFEFQVKPAKISTTTKRRKSKKRVDVNILSPANFKTHFGMVKKDEESNRRVMETLNKVASDENSSELASTNELLSILADCNIALVDEDRAVGESDATVIAPLNNVSVEGNIRLNVAGKSELETNSSYINVINDVAKFCDLPVVESDGSLEDKHAEGDRPFVCPRCRYSARKKGQLRKHLGVHGIYACAHCAFTSNGHIGLDEHMKDNHPSRCGRRLCKRCHVLFRLDLIDVHEVECTGVKQGWNCSVCGKRFKFVSALHTHLRRWHGSSAPSMAANETNAECSESTTPALSSVVCHEQDVVDANCRSDSEGIISSFEKCDFPEKSDPPEKGGSPEKSDSLEKSDSPEKSHNKKKKKKSKPIKEACKPIDKKNMAESHVKEPVDRSMKCDRCSKSFKRQQSLEKHIFLKHVKLVEAPSDNLNQQKCTNPEEEQVLQSLSVVPDVINSHVSDPPPKPPAEDVDAIQFTASSISDIDSSEIKKIADETAIVKTSEGISKQPPAFTSTAERFFCTAMGCGKEFRKLKQLHRHAERHIEEEKPYHCDWTGCRKAFIFSENLAYHKQQHTDPKPFPCLQCSAGYWQKCSLRVHQRRMHRVAPLGKKNNCATTTTTNLEQQIDKTTTSIQDHIETKVPVRVDDESTDIDEPFVEVKEQYIDLKDTNVNDMKNKPVKDITDSDVKKIKDTHISDTKEVHVSELCEEVNHISVITKDVSIEYQNIRDIELSKDIKLKPKKRVSKSKVKRRRSGVKARKAGVKKNQSSERNKPILLDSMNPSENQSVAIDDKQIPTITDEVELLKSAKRTKTKQFCVKKERLKKEKEVFFDSIISNAVQSGATNDEQLPMKTDVELVKRLKPSKAKKVCVKIDRSNMRGRKRKCLSVVRLSSTSSIQDLPDENVFDKIEESTDSCVLSKKRSKKIKIEKPKAKSDRSVKAKTSVVYPDILSNIVDERKPQIESNEISIYEFCEEDDHKVELLKSIRRSATTGIKDSTTGVKGVTAIKKVVTTGIKDTATSKRDITTGKKDVISSKKDVITGQKDVTISVKDVTGELKHVTTDVKDVTLKPTSLELDTIEIIKQPPASLKTYLKPRNKTLNVENKPAVGSHDETQSAIIPQSVISVPKTATACGTKRKLETMDDRIEKRKSPSKNKRSPKTFGEFSVSSRTEKRKSTDSMSDTDDKTVDARNDALKKKQSKKVDVDAVGCSTTKTTKKRRKLEIENVNIICEGTVRMTMIEAQIRITEMSRDGSRKNSRKDFKKSKVSDVVTTFPQIEFTAKTNKDKRGNISRIKIKGCRRRGSSSKSKRKSLRKQTGSFEVVDVSCKKKQNKSENKSKSTPQLRLSNNSQNTSDLMKENMTIDLGEEPCVEMSIVEAVSRIAKKRSEQLLKPVVFDESSSQSSNDAEETRDNPARELRDTTTIENIAERDSTENVAQNYNASTVNPVDTEYTKIDNVVSNRDVSMIPAENRNILNSSLFRDIDLGQSENRSGQDCINSAIPNDYNRQLKDARSLSPVDVLPPMEDISPRNLENLSVPSTGSPYSSERDDNDDIPMTPPPLRRETTSNSSRDSLDSKVASMSHERQSDCVTRDEEGEDVSSLSAYQAVPVITNTHQSQQLEDHVEERESIAAADLQSRNYGDDNQRFESVREYMDNNPGRYEASLDNYTDNQVMYRERSHSPLRNSHQQDRPENATSRNALNYVYHDSIPSAAYVERQYTRAERNPLQSLEGLAAGSVTGSPGGPGGGYFDQNLSQEEVGGKQALYIQPHHRSSYGMTSPNESYLADLGPPPSVGRAAVRPTNNHPTPSLDPTVTHGQQARPPSHTTTPTGREISANQHADPLASHVAPPTPGGHSTVPPTGNPVEYGRVSDPRFIIQRSPPDNASLSRPVSHAAVPGFPSDSFAKDFFGQYFQDPTSHLNALSGGPAAGQDQRGLGGYMGQQLPPGFSRAQADLFRCTPSALISNSPYSSIPESFLGMKPPGPPQSSPAQGQHWSSSVGDERSSRPWSNQTSSMLDMDSGSRNTYPKLDTYAPETMSLSFHSSSSKRGSVPGGNAPSSDLMFPGAPSSASHPPPPVVQATDKYGIPSAYSSLAHSYSPTGAPSTPGPGGGYSSRGLASASSTSQKQFEDAYRHAAVAQLNDYRTLAAAQAQHAPMPPDVYMAGINPSSLAGFDRYYYASARDAMYRSHHLAATAMPHHFMQQGSAASQQVYGDRGGASSIGYGREGMYAQPSPYSFIGGGSGGGGGGNGGEKQYLSGSSGKGSSSSQGGPSVAHADYLPPNSAVDVQDPYRRSVIYNMMTPRYF